MSNTGGTSGVWLIIFITVPFFLISAFATANYIPSEAVVASDGDDEPSQVVVAKRPFCNAFTGCGRKRSNLDVNELPDENDELWYNKIRQHLLRTVKQRTPGFEAKLDRPKMALRLPYIEYAVDRKRRMATM
ncbi:hypothetical protein CHUAL_009893 [Chamberlinius hualienensis]